MNKKIIVCLLLTVLLLAGSAAEAQQAVKVPQLGYLTPGFPSTGPVRIEAFLQGLRELGYIEGQNIAIEYRYAEGRQDRYPALVADLVRLKVDVIVTHGSTGTRAAKEITSTLPIVMANDPDPVGSGFVASLARPGGNITGLSALAPELSGKRLELVKETVPRLSRIAILGTSSHPGNAQNFRETEIAAEAFRIMLQYQEVMRPEDIETAFRAASKSPTDALLVLGSFVQINQRTQIAALASRSRLPVMYPQSEFVEVGGLMSYGVNRNDMARRAAMYVHKILKGAKPADLPVEQPTKFELVINLKTAKALGLTIPPAVLYRADRIIK